MTYFRNLVTYKQYELLRGDTHLITWLNNPQLKLHTKIKLIDDDPLWWEVIGVGSVTKIVDETPDTCLC